MDRTKANLIETYNRYALDRDRRRIASWKIPERDRFLQLLREESKALLLDLGAGTGKDSKFFKDSGLKTVSCDISYEMVNLCREKGLPVVLMDFCSLGSRVTK